ncbi:MAG: glycosyltransferase family 2 protein [Isosphaeraceae bacterium]|nr:glycosyltransferase family 2 protein [Isosphaeraceae bacterium]
MTPNQRTILWIYAGIIAIWPIRHIVVGWAIRQLDILTPRSPRYHGESFPLVSAIIPAKDEEKTLADCLASVCAQEYPNLEIIVVNDRSTDRTAAIAQEFADRDPRVRVLTIDNLPAGWTGKTHALQTAAEQARGEWFWFLDADTRHTPENLPIVLEYARRTGAALASLLPEMRCESFWENVVQPLAGVMLVQSFPLFLVNNDRSKKAFANGQYILVQRSAYFAAGGHHAVRDRFVEDIGMAYRVKQLGLPIRVAIAHGIGSTRMYASLGQLVRGWSRILYDALDRNPWRLLARLLDPLIFSQTGEVILAVSLFLLASTGPSPFALWLLGLCIVHHVLSYTLLHRLYVLSVPRTRYTAWFPVANLVMDWVLLRALRSCLTGQVTWRGTAYGRSLSATSPAHPEVAPVEASVNLERLTHALRTPWTERPPPAPP